MTKKETFKWIVQIIASIATANDLLHGVLDKKSVLEIFPERFELTDEINILFLKNDAFCA